MLYPSVSPNYSYQRLGYPVELGFKCPACGAPVAFCHPDDGKMVECLDEIIYQVTDLFTCTNEACEMSTLFFNPVTRFDYGPRHYGLDVFKFIAEECLPPLS